ncbi:LysR family transcriptional regulator ArgP [Larsenimonas salina]|uniref:LysR family transcriptional regulator ArgP n=1 Tax=Larsenimonas salina TaxID=1295565 RepID=UPI002073A5AA|nr:LysR family transcriptional regulator ArgP [Larsenimonas salina]MCM5703528.1 LysR family transcriptional regulator ArgP [Larsenimonas salina]
MLDYKLLEALSAVIDQGGFERGANYLGLTQSAVSQRIKLLEARLGQPVLVRSPTLGPTALGKRLLNHAQQVRLLEYDLIDIVPSLGTDEQRLRIALNADSLATWWPLAVGPFSQEHRVLLDLVVQDQTTALQRMRDGEVAACLCSTPRAVQGARVVSLGGMRYMAVATPHFIKRYFPEGLNADSLSEAPGIVFGPDDRLHHRMVAQYHIAPPFPHHICPSSQGVVQMTVAGLGYALLPEHQARPHLESGALAEIETPSPVIVPMYWHYWRQGGQLLSSLTSYLSEQSPNWLLSVEETERGSPTPL